MTEPRRPELSPCAAVVPGWWCLIRFYPLPLSDSDLEEEKMPAYIHAYIYDNILYVQCNKLVK